MIHSILNSVKLNLKNIPGWKTKKKYIAFECDDYGGIRMPSLQVLEKLKNTGIPIDEHRYNTLDTLENATDLDNLFSVLNSVKDHKNHAVVFTPFVNVATPDFKAIINSGYSEYFSISLKDSLKYYQRSESTFSKYLSGIQQGIFVPQLHGRDHINVPSLMRELKKGNKQLENAIQSDFVSINVQGLPDFLQEFRPEFYFESELDLPILKNAIYESVEYFKALFGYQPTVFVPGNSIFHPILNSTLIENNIAYLNVAYQTPTPTGKGGLTYRKYYSGQKADGFLTYYIRNCAFEPMSDDYNGIDLTLKQIEAAFKWNKPAIISTHRVNFLNQLNPGNGDKGLNELSKLIKRISQKWPEAEFIDSGSLYKLMSN